MAIHTNIWLLNAAVIGIFAVFGYTLSRILKRNDIADGLWGTGFILLAIANFPQSFLRLPFHSQIILTLVSLWGIRLSIYLWRRLLQKSEDPRYLAWRKEWGAREPWTAFWRVFMLQGFFMGIIATPVIYVVRAATPESLGPWSFLGLMVFLLGFIFESIADAQMAEFKRDPQNKGKFLTTGLWSLCRHPNYWGEILVWWGLSFFALDLPGGAVTLTSPLFITFLLTKVSGVPMLENLLKKKGADFTQYLGQSRALIPFSRRDLLLFFKVAAILIALDFLWLGLALNAFYVSQLSLLARTHTDGSWDVLPWPVFGVYFCLALGIVSFAIIPGRGRADSVFRAAMFGLLVYGVYEFTNLALIKDWPFPMAALDILWGVFLCGLSAFFAKPRSKTNP